MAGSNGLGGVVEALDHYVGGLDESRCCLAFFQLELTDCICGDDCGDVGVSNSEDDFGEEAFDADADYFAGELVAAADAAETLAGLGGRFGFVFDYEGLEGCLGETMVAAGGLDGLQFAAQYPLLDGGIADPNQAGGFAGRQLGCGRWHGNKFRTFWGINGSALAFDLT